MISNTDDKQGREGYIVGVNDFFGLHYNNLA